MKMLRELLVGKQETSIYLGDHKSLTKTIFGHKMIVDSRDRSLAPHLLIDGYWESWITKVIMNRVKKSMNVIEIGANFGYYSLIMADKVGEGGKIFAFEANPMIVELLNDNLLINGFSDRAKVENMAVTDKVGEVVLNIPYKFYGDSSIVQLEHVSTEKLHVRSMSLDTYFEKFTEPIDFIKIDAEGSEPLIFNGMKELISKNPHVQIVCEFCQESISASEEPRTFLEKLRSYGFKLHYISEAAIIKETSINELLKMNLCELYLKRGS